MDGNVPRGYYRQPLIVAPPGVKGTTLGIYERGNRKGELENAIAYTRASKVSDALDDTYFLDLYKQRLVAKGIASREDLAVLVLATDDKRELNSLCAKAREVARESEKSNKGTAIHALAQKWDEGKTVPKVPAAFRSDLIAYIELTKKHQCRWTDVERFLVCDELQVAGTPDRIGHIFDEELERELFAIGDVKTGSVSPYFSYGDWAVQLAIYAHSCYYDFSTGKRTPIAGLNQQYAYVLAVPQGTGTGKVYRVDIEAGWEGAKLATHVKEWRKKAKTLAEKIAPAEKERT